jgi:hypothetical protein
MIPSIPAARGIIAGLLISSPFWAALFWALS